MLGLSLNVGNMLGLSLNGTFGGGAIKAGGYLLFKSGKVFKVERIGDNAKEIKKARGLEGSDFENWIQQNFGGTGEFKAMPPSNRKIDGKLPDGTWYEAKSAFNYLFNSDGSKNLRQWSKFTSQLTDGKAAAVRAGANYELITNVTPPLEVVDWATKKNIPIRMVE